MSVPARQGEGAHVCRLLRLAALVAMGALVAARGSEPASDPAPRVLLINSYSPTTRWSVELTAGVREVMAEHVPQATLTVEHLGEGTVPAEVAAAHLAERLQREHARRRFAVMIAADDAAFEFARAERDRILPGTPLVFCGVSDLPPDVLGPHSLTTGTILVRDVSAVMASALQRHPATRALVVVHDLSPAGLAYREQAQSWSEELMRRRPGMVVVFLSAAQYSTPELIEQIRVLPLDCVVLLTAWSQDRDGHAQQLDDVLARVARVSPVPVYGVTGSGSAFSTSTARLAEAHQQGRTAGTVAVKVLQGVPPSEIPIRIVRCAPDLEAAAYIVDDAPRHAVASPQARPLIAAPLPRPAFLGLCAVTALVQAALIAMLFVTLRRRQQTQRDLDEARRRTAQIVDSAELGVLEWDLGTGALTFSAHSADRLGCLPDDVEPTRRHWESMVHPADLPAVLAAVQECLDDHRTSYSVRYRMLTAGRTYRWVLERGEVVARLPDGTPSRLLGIQTDGDLPADLGGMVRP